MGKRYNTSLHKSKFQKNLEISRILKEGETENISAKKIHLDERYDAGYTYFGQFYDKFRIDHETSLNIKKFTDLLIGSPISYKVLSYDCEENIVTFLMTYESKTETLKMDTFVVILEKYEATEEDNEDAIYISGRLNIYCDSKDVNSNFFETIENIFIKAQKEKTIEITMNLHVVQASQGGLSLKKFESKKYPVMDRMDLHYGKEFPEFYSDLINKLRTKSNGLVLLHGKPGTGKTHLIRQIIMDLREDKRCVVIPNSIFDQLNTPNMINLIVDDPDEKPIVLILEDAEQLLLQREDGGYSVANILNMTDGLMNDICNVQIIATFNTDKKSIDSALLRENRLIAKHNFDKLPVEMVKELFEHLEVKEEATVPMTLSEIYSIKNNTGVTGQEALLDTSVIW